MNITLINTRDQFYELRQAWDEIYAKDPDARIFQSWPWLRGWIESTPHEWFVLAIQQHETCQSAHADQADSASTHSASERGLYIGFLALSRRPGTEDASHYRLFMGGVPFADYTGFVCLPEYVDEAIPALAAFIRDHVEWDIFCLRNVSDPRIERFLNHLSSSRISIQEIKGSPCPHIALPETWEQYFKEGLGRSTRRTLTKYLNRMERLDGFHLTESQSDNIEPHIDTLLSLWQARWGLKTDDSFLGFGMRDVLDIKRSLFRSCFANHCLRLSILWDKATPVAAAAAFVDIEKKTIVWYTIAVNYAYAEHSPGTVLCLYAIRHAIENGFRVFDFGGGAEEYKFYLGAKERFSRNVNVTRVGLIMALRSRLQIRTRLNRLKECLMGANVVDGTG